MVLCCQGVLCALEVVKINTLGVFCQRECVSWRVQGHYFGGLCVVIWFDYLVDYPVVFWGLDVALGLRVNQYKLLVYFSLTPNSFKFCFKLYWYKQPIISKKQPIVFLLLCCFYCLYSWLTWFLFWIHTKNFVKHWKSFRKPLLNNSLPLSFKAIYSNRLGTKFEWWGHLLW